MIVYHPFFISSRLAPALRVGNAVISLIEVSNRDSGGRSTATFVIDLPGREGYIDNKLKSGCQGFGRIQDIFVTFLSFLDSAAESYQCAGMDGENSDLFPEYITEWASHNSDETGMLRFEIEETYKTLVEV